MNPVTYGEGFIPLTLPLVAPYSLLEPTWLQNKKHKVGA